MSGKIHPATVGLSQDIHNILKNLGLSLVMIKTWNICQKSSTKITLHLEWNFNFPASSAPLFLPMPVNRVIHNLQYAASKNSDSPSATENGGLPVKNSDL